MGSAAISPLGAGRPGLCRRLGTQRAGIWALLALVVALWLATRPYLGIVGDGRLYAVQALNALQHGHFADDMYFQFGSQDQFTLFSRLYAPFLALLGIGHGALVLTILTQAAWVAGLVLLVHALTGDIRQALIVAAAVIALPAQYAPLGFGELFVSPRLFSEALSMLALAVLLRGSRVWSLAILLASASIHPLATVPALAAWFCYQFRPRPAWFGAATVLLAVPVSLCLAGVAPFTWLGETFDPAWYDIVHERDPLVFLLEWRPIDHVVVLTNVALAICVFRLTSGRVRHFLGAVFVVGVGGLVVTVLGGDLGHDVFVVDAQAWRAMWLLTVVSHGVAALWLLRSMPRLRQFDARETMLLAGLALLLVARFVQPIYWLAAATLVAGCLIGLTGRMAPRVVRVVLLAMTGATAVAVAIAFAYGVDERAGEFWPAFVVLAPAVLALSAAWFVMTSATVTRRAAGMLAATSVVACAIAVSTWDQRTPWTRYVESGAASRDFAGVIPQRASVYWDGGIEMLWLGLDRSSYFSCNQGSGLLFSRGTAMAYLHRQASLFPLKEHDFADCMDPGQLEALDPRPISLEHACQREVGLDYVILGRRFDGVPAREWDAPVPLAVEWPNDPPGQRETTRRFFVYSCAEIRASGV
jgi:hypothetical protein